MKKIIPLSVVAAILPLLSFAHEGHGHTHGFTITHYFVEPEHLVVLLCVFAASILYFRRSGKKTATRE